MTLNAGFLRIVIDAESRGRGNCEVGLRSATIVWDTPVILRCHEGAVPEWLVVVGLVDLCACYWVS